MIELTRGDLLKANTEAIVNAVNCVGVMGRGIALQFKKKWPDNFKAYALACKNKELQPGNMFIYEIGQATHPRFIVNFPTKRHWREASRIEDIETGLIALVDEIKQHNIKSIAIPPLGAGLGGLAWPVVYEKIKSTMEPLIDVHILIYAPIDELELLNK
ncbi:ADP-ribose 1-phosphate phophatase family protein [Proteus hauseri ATCC 700826]|uniref:ADP-ribose 1-phosphate phophatase family protein n=1 Tax=Proteus hauseri ATCC 700826 TaxID=1354271 RepID=A0AAJ3HS56_PROHU|nr:macro domain-containing protein [Proteus hauseri]OAT46589.1 ADP-ribose 1-phosphate phophatase family protein [Proteus hauseri ATCC 700826]